MKSAFGLPAGAVWLGDYAGRRGPTGSDKSRESYRQISNIGGTKSQTLSTSHLVLRVSLSNALKPSVKSRMKMYLEQRWQAMLELQLRD